MLRRSPSARGRLRGTKAYPGPLALGSHTFQVQAVERWQDEQRGLVHVGCQRGSTDGRLASPSGLVPHQCSFRVLDGHVLDERDRRRSDRLRAREDRNRRASSTVSLSGSGTAYTATMASTGTGDGTVGLNVVDDDTIMDGAARGWAGRALGTAASPASVYGIDKTGPSERANDQPRVRPAMWSSTSATFAFSSSESGVAGFQCSLNGGSFVSCSSSTSYSGLAQGARSFAVRGVDAVGNAGPAATRAWTVDTVPQRSSSRRRRPTRTAPRRRTSHGHSCRRIRTSTTTSAARRTARSSQQAAPRPSSSTQSKQRPAPVRGARRRQGGERDPDLIHVEGREGVDPGLHD